MSKIRNATCEVFDEFVKSALDTVEEKGEEGPIAIWGMWYHHPFVSEFKHALFIDKERKQKCDER